MLIEVGSNVISVFEVNSQANMLLLAADPGDICKRTDTFQMFILKTLPANVIGNWIEINPGLDVTTHDLVARHPITVGGTGAANAADARTNLGLVIGTNVQGKDAMLDWIIANLSVAGKALIDDASAAAQRTTLDTYSKAESLALLSSLGSILPENFLPNCQWQLWSGLGYITKQNVEGTGNQTAISCSSFDTLNNEPTFITAETSQLKNGDLAIVSGGGFQWAYAGVGYVATATSNRVVSLVNDTSFKLQAQLGGVSPAASVAVTVTPISPGDLGALGTGQCADGWKKTTTLSVWPDDFTANGCPGAIRVLGVRKGAATTESINWGCPSNTLRKYLGRTISIGALVRQKVQAGAGTWTISIVDAVGGTTTSAAGTGVAYSDPTYGGFEFKFVTATISPVSTGFNVHINFNGADNDVYYVALPTGLFGSTMVVNNCRQNVTDVMRPVTHWNPPLLTPLTMTFPAAPYIGVLYGFSDQDLEAMSLGVIHNSVAMVKCKIELITSTVGAMLFTGSKLDYSLTFGPQTATQVATVCNIGQGWLPLAHDGTFCIFTGTPTLVITNATFDFDEVYLSMASAAP